MHIYGITDQLGIPWELSKDTPFSSAPTFIGFVWDLENKTVGLTSAKHTKYTDTVHEWLCTTAHNLEQVQTLYGRLSHTTFVIPEGSTYLTSLQSMLGIFGSNLFMPCRQLQGTISELHWWLWVLSSKPPIPIPVHLHATDHQAFSDASSSCSLAIIISPKWRAWRLSRHWKNNGRDIRWAESIAFEMLICALLTLDCSSSSLKVYCDNQGIVDGWKKGRSWNTPTNNTFWRIHALLASPLCWVFPSYVPSADNPVDGPSHGRYPPAASLLPPVPILEDLHRLILNYDNPECDTLCI